MQTELLAENPATRIRILGLNERGYEQGNGLMADHGSIPWIQPGANDDTWGDWAVEYRDTVIVDTTGQAVDVFNLTQHDLAIPDEYAALKALLLQAAGE